MYIIYIPFTYIADSIMSSAISSFVVMQKCYFTSKHYE